MPKTIQSNFNAGEWSPLLWSRVPLRRFGIACRKVTNFIITAFGVARKRQGLEYLAPAFSDTGKVRLESFVFSNDVTHLLEFGNNFVRFWEDGVPEVGGLFTPYTSDQLSQLRFFAVNDVVYIAHADHETRELSRDTPTSWSLSVLTVDEEPFQEENDTAITLRVSSIDISNVDLIASDDLFDESWVGSTVSLRHIQAAQIFRTSFDEVREGPPYRKEWTDAATNIFSAGDIIFVNDAANGLDPLWTCKADYNGFDDYVGGLMNPEDYPAFFEIGIVAVDPQMVYGAWTFQTEGTWQGEWWLQESEDDGATWSTRYQMATSGSENFLREGDEEDNPLLLRVLAVTGRAETNLVTLTIAETTRSGTVLIDLFLDAKAVCGTIEKDVFSADATLKWAENEWSPRRGYPSQVMLHEARLILAGTKSKPQTVWGSRVDDFEDFGGGGVDADDPFSITLFSGDQNPIRWLSAQRVLLIGLSNSVRALIGEQERTLQPGKIRAPRQGGKGSADLQPLEADDFTFYVQQGGRVMRALQNDYERAVFAASDITAEAEHITKGGVVQLAYKQNREAMLYAVTGEGKLAVFAIEPSQDVRGWYGIETDGIIESVAVLPTDGEEDEVYVAVMRNINGADVRYIERLKVGQYRVQDDEETDDLFFVDAGIEYSGAPVTTITGLDHLEGKEVNVLANGAIHPPRTVVSGQIALQYEASRVNVGLPYTATLWPMKTEALAASGTAQGGEMRLQEIVVDFYKTLNCQFAEDPDGVREEIPFRDLDPLGEEPEPKSGYIPVRTDFGNTWDGSVALIHDDPTCCTIRTLITRWTTKGK